MASRDLNDASPVLATAFLKIKEIFEATFPKYEIRPTCTLRSDAEQLEAFEAKRSRIDPRIPAQRAKANHLAGADHLSRAIDVGIFRKNPGGLPSSYLDDLLAAGKFDADFYRSLYWNFGQLVQRFGFRWGGDWNGNAVMVGVDRAESLNDPYHMEISGGA